MLSLLHIENIAVIERSDISFDAGFNVLTGETGAGKSIVIDAISAVLGERAYRDMIRTGAQKASVRAVFSDVPRLGWFEENGVEYDSEVVIHREIHLDGKNVCRVNGSLVSVGILRKLGIQLINIHGQHDSASLFDENNHLQFLDITDSVSRIKDLYFRALNVAVALKRRLSRVSGGGNEDERGALLTGLSQCAGEKSRHDLQSHILKRCGRTVPKLHRFKVVVDVDKRRGTANK